MSYKQGEADLLTLAQTLTEWDGANSVSVSNDTTHQANSLINSGVGQYLFLSPGSFESEYASIADTFTVTVWQTILTIVVFDSSTGNAPENDLITLRQALMDKFDSYFQGDSASTVSIVKIANGREVETWKRRTEPKKTFYVAEMTAVWAEERTFTQND